MGFVYLLLTGLLMVAAGGWFIVDGVRGGHIELGGARTGTWSAELRAQPIQFGCITFIWALLALIGLGMVLGSAVDMEPRYYPMVPAMLLLPWSLWRAQFHAGASPEASLHRADAALRRGDPRELAEMAQRRAVTALDRLIGEAVRLRLPPNEPAQGAGGYRQRHDGDERLRAQVAGRLDHDARRQQWRLLAGWSPALAGMLPLPVLLLSGARWEMELHAFIAGLLALGLFVLSSRSWWRARVLLLRAPSLLAAAAVAGGSVFADPEATAQEDATASGAVAGNGR